MACMKREQDVVGYIGDATAAVSRSADKVVELVIVLYVRSRFGHFCRKCESSH